VLSPAVWRCPTRKVERLRPSSLASTRVDGRVYPKWWPENELATDSSESEVFQILALSGGGFLGLYTADILVRLEKIAGKPLGRCFDLISGTSVGGILAIGLALEKSAESMRDMFIADGEKIFSARSRPRFGWFDARRSFFSPKYDGTALKDAVGRVIGKETKISEAKHRLLVPAVNMTKGSFQMFKTGHHPAFHADPGRRAVDVAMATSAAPTYFPLADVDNAHFVDGGLVANAPDLCALHEARHFLRQDVRRVHILSIGTTSMGFSLARSIGRNLGSWKWMTRGRLFTTVVSAQQQLVDYILSHELADRYLRIDATPSIEQQADLALDVADASARGTLLGLAEGSFQRFSADPRLTRFLSHAPIPPQFFDSAESRERSS
jgi:patatin-like phospholipase/acyl hydrolase